MSEVEKAEFGMIFRFFFFDFFIIKYMPLEISEEHLDQMRSMRDIQRIKVPNIFSKIIQGFLGP